jgi:hypothetical protein
VAQLYLLLKFVHEIVNVNILILINQVSFSVRCESICRVLTISTYEFQDLTKTKWNVRSSKSGGRLDLCRDIRMLTQLSSKIKDLHIAVLL